MHDQVAGRGAAGHIIHGDGLRGDGIGGHARWDGAARDVAIGGERGIVDLDRLPHVHERGAAGHRHRERAAGDRS